MCELVSLGFSGVEGVIGRNMCLVTALLRGGPAAPRCSSWPCAAQALWPRQALPPRQRDGLRCFIGSATGAQPQRHGRRIFKKHVSGLDDFEKIPNLNWDKFDKGDQQGQSRWTYALAHHRPGRCGESRTGARVARRLPATECAAVRTRPWARRGDTVHAGARLEHS